MSVVGSWADRIAAAVTSRRSWVLALLVAAAAGALMGLLGGGDSGEQSPVAVPPSAESAQARELQSQFPGGDTAPAILVVTRDDGGALTPGDLAAVRAARQRMLAAGAKPPGRPQCPRSSSPTTSRPRSPRSR